MGKHQDPSLVNKFHSSYIPEPMSGCWLWFANQRSSEAGYGFLCGPDGSMEASHRFSYLIYHGNIPDDHHVHHKCENQYCVNPDHLQCLHEVDHGKIRHTNSLNKKICKNGLHDITNESSYAIYRGNKVCLACARANEARLRESSRVGDSYCNKGHLLTDDNTYWNKRPGWCDRSCRTCRIAKEAGKRSPKFSKADRESILENWIMADKCKRGHLFTSKEDCYVNRCGEITCKKCAEYCKERYQAKVANVRRANK